MPEIQPIDLNSKTTFILGAGASKPFGLPLGSELKQILLGNLSNSDVRKNISEYGFSTTLINDFHEALAGTYHPTIDIFLEKKTTFRALGAYIIAYSLLPLEHHANLFPQRDWYGHMYHVLNFEQTEPTTSNITFVTLNYDRSLEHFLIRNIQYNCEDSIIQHAEAKLKDITIIHAHGSLGSYPNVTYGAHPTNKEVLREAAEGIRIVSDTLENSNDFQNARRAIYSADNIVFIGFGYDSVTQQKLFGGIDTTRKRILGTIFHVRTERRQQLSSYFSDKFEYMDISTNANLFITKILPGRPMPNN